MMTAASDAALGTERAAVSGRILATIPDFILAGGLSYGVEVGIRSGLGSALAPVATETVMLSSLLLAITTMIGYFVGFEWRFGQTPGKWLADVLVVDRHGSRLTLKAAVLRNLLRPVDFIGGYLLGILSIAVTDRSQRIGDLAAGTVVVRTNSATGPSPDHPSVNRS